MLFASVLSACYFLLLATSNVEAAFHSNGYIARKGQSVTTTELGPNYPAGKSDVHPAPRFNFKKERLDLIKEPRLPSWAETVEHNNKQTPVKKSNDEDLMFQQQVAAALDKVKNSVSASPPVVDDPFRVDTTPVTHQTSLSSSSSSSPSPSTTQSMEVKKPSRVGRFFRGFGRIFGSAEKVKEYDITNEAVVAYPWRTSDE